MLRSNEVSVSLCLRALLAIVSLASLLLAAACGFAGSVATASSPGSGAGSPAGVLTPGSQSISFGNVPVGTSDSQPIMLTNTGSSNVNITSASVTGSGLSISGGSNVSLPPNQSVTINVIFSPTQAGTIQGSLLISSSASNSSLTIPLSGTGTQAEIAANSAGVLFGTVTVGDSDSQPIILQNNGNITLTFSQIAVLGSEFGQTGLSTSTTVAAGGSITFYAVFTPSSGGSVSGSITLTTNGTPSPLVINLSGTGETAALSLSASPPNLTFGNVNDGSNSSLPTSVKNNGNSNITISAVTVTGAGFGASGIPNGTVLTPGQSVTLNVTFAPTSPGAVNGASVTITSNATNSPLAIPLSGTGTHSVLLQWTASTTAGVTYNVFRGTSPGGESTTPLNPSPVSMTSYTDTNVTSGDTYYYTVEAVDSAGSSAPSNEAQAKIPTP